MLYLLSRNVQGLKNCLFSEGKRGSGLRALLRLVCGAFALVSHLAEADPRCPPTYEWQRSFGGSKQNPLRGMALTSDGGMILAGLSTSGAEGNKTCAGFGQADGWLVRLDKDGEKLWDLCLGGVDVDLLSSVQETTDGGFIAVGTSSSPPGGNKTAPLTIPGAQDIWLVRVSPDGQILWDRSLGPAAGAEPKVRQTRNDGFIVGASIPIQPPGEPLDGKFFGGFDFGILRLDSDGHRLWDASFGGNGHDQLGDVIETEDGGFLLVGSSDSPSGPPGNKDSFMLGQTDGWVVRVDAQGHKLWDKAYGSNTGEGFCCAAVASGGGAFLSGSSVEGLAGVGHYWVVLIDGKGNALSEQFFGTSGVESATSMAALPDGGVVLIGNSAVGTNNLGSRTSLPVGGGGYWLVRLDGSGRKLWDVAYGAEDDNWQFASVVVTSDGRIAFAATSRSRGAPSVGFGLTGNRTVPRLGLEDYWVVKLAAENPSEEVQVYPSNVRPFAKSEGEIGFRFHATGPTNLIYSLESSTNLSDWIPFRTNIPGTRLREVLDPSITNNLKRYFRALAVPPP